MKSNPYDAPTPSIGEGPPTPDQISNIRRPRFKTHVVAIGMWQVTALAMMFLYGNAIGHIVVAVYTWRYGDIQSSYGRFERLSTYTGLLLITLVASVAAIAIVAKLLPYKCTLKQNVLVAVCWQSVTMILLAGSYEFGFPYMINQLGWRMFGAPTEVYSFQNLVLHRIIAWLICTIPTGILAVWFWSRLYAHRRDTPG